MCYTIPGKVEKIEGNIAVLEYFGERKKALNELVSLAVGDYAYAQGGYIIEKIPPHQAKEILKDWKDIFFQLQKIDSAADEFNLNNKSLSPRIKDILARASQGETLKRQDYTLLLGQKGKEERGGLYSLANFLRRKYHRNACCVHGIIEISNYCRRNCAYCGISTKNSNLGRYRMNKEEILEAVGEAVGKHNFKALVLQSGEDAGYKIEELADIIREIKQRYPVLLFISFGEIGIEGLKKLFSAGARGLLMRFETSNQALYAKLNPGRSLASRLEHIKKAFELGYLIITGGLIGIPGQTQEDIINDIFLTKELNAEMFSFGPFLAHPETDLSASQAPSEELVFNTLALIRLIAPREAKILVTTAFETMSGQARQKGLISGANSLMLNATPLKYRRLYEIYPHRAHADEDIGIQVQEVAALLKTLGRVPVDLSIGLAVKQ